MPAISVRTFPATDPVEAFFATTSRRAGNKLACVKTAAVHKMIRAATKMWSGVAQDDSELQPRRSSINLKPWWSQGAAAETHAATRVGVRAADSRLVDNRWVLEGPAPAWFRGAEHLRQGTPLALSDAFRVIQLLSAGDADELEALLRVQVLPDPAASAPAFAVESDPAFRHEVPDDADVYWGPDGLLGVTSRDVGRNRHYQLVERPSPAHGPRYVNALSLCQRQASRPKRARPAPLLPLSPQLKRARSLASVDNFHDIDAAQALAELVSA